MAKLIPFALPVMTLLVSTATSTVYAQPCTGDADCTSPLTCKAGSKVCRGGAGMLPDGGIYTIELVCENGPSQCTWTFVRCQADTDCTETNWACLIVPGQTAVRTCFPKAIVCSAGQACPSAWSCVDFSQVHDRDALQIWTATENNYCWPDSLKSVLSREARTDSSGLGLSGGTSGTDKSSADAAVSLGGDGSGRAVDGGASASPPTDPVPPSEKSGCTIRGRNGSDKGTMVVVALVGLVGLARASSRSRAGRDRTPGPGQ